MSSKPPENSDSTLNKGDRKTQQENTNQNNIIEMSFDEERYYASVFINDNRLGLDLMYKSDNIPNFKEKMIEMKSIIDPIIALRESIRDEFEKLLDRKDLYKKTTRGRKFAISPHHSKEDPDKHYLAFFDIERRRGGAAHHLPMRILIDRKTIQLFAKAFHYLSVSAKAFNKEEHIPIELDILNNVGRTFPEVIPPFNYAPKAPEAPFPTPGYESAKASTNDVNQSAATSVAPVATKLDSKFNAENTGNKSKPRT